jgi:phosphate starvation-inducible protein PhoH and related proteins
LESQDKLEFDDNALLAQIGGPAGRNLKLMTEELGLQIHARGNTLTLVGSTEEREVGRRLLNQLYALAKRGRHLEGSDLVRAARLVQADINANLKAIFTDVVLSTGAGVVRPRGQAQSRYIDAMRTKDVVFGVGPAGTGKTYLAVAMAVAALQRNDVRRIVLTRPAVEAGEKLGFLPGDMVEKVNPYLRPLYDALDDLIEGDRAGQMLARGHVEVAPLAFMRGRTLNGSFVILDEAQNTTSEQMLMFLTRLGYDSKAVITGDITQTDLPGGVRSGLAEATQVLQNVEGIGVSRFTEEDVVRHPLVGRIIKAYDQRDSSTDA